MHLNNKNQKIRIQQKLIEQLEAENNHLKKQLESCRPETISQKLALAEESLCKYQTLCKELSVLKCEYQTLTAQLAKDQNTLRHFIANSRKELTNGSTNP